MPSKEFNKLIPKIVEFMKSQPITKAWLFGSCSRGEERADSDIDLLVSYDEDANVSLLTVSHIRNRLMALTGRDVDLVEDGTLLPFALPSANKDKIIIYERETPR